jgi:hypothetical protein
MAIYITEKDKFVWLDVTDQMKYGNKMRETLWNAHELFVIYDDDSDSVVESHDEIDEALRLGLKIGIEVGHLPKSVSSKTHWWSKADKKIIEGFWWVKLADIKFG